MRLCLMSLFMCCAIHAESVDKALVRALEWRASDPGDVLALVALSEVYVVMGNTKAAAQCIGSLIDLFPSRADLRRMAGERLEQIKGGLPLAEDTFAKAVEQRPDHPSSHRLHAYALVKLGRFEEAFNVIEAGRNRSYPSGRFAGVPRILDEDLGLIAADWRRAEPLRAREIAGKLDQSGIDFATTPTVRFVLNWETDANDVDFHIFDGKKGHAYYSSPQLPSGGELYADVTTGYGPECFTIENPRAFPYVLQAHYYSRGPMGYGMGKLQVIAHDGQGKLVFEENPFVIMKDSAYIDLGTVTDLE
ncbi:MAG: hypothetical protein HN348_06670 [Proteobacteria bacterium]|nr:hypothetical protein [Pseudomonadota bacterium]